MSNSLRILFPVILLVIALAGGAVAAPIQAMILDGRQAKSHDWMTTTPLLKKYLESTGLFAVEVVTAPPLGQDLSGFKPDFSRFAVVVLNYDDDQPWPQETQDAFLNFVRKGGGVVVYHAANNAFPKWQAYNQIIGLGGWRGRDEKSGPYVRFKGGKTVLDSSPGKGGSHGPQGSFLIEAWNPKHPVMKGLPAQWMNSKDELYDRLRGPAQNLEVLATAFSDSAKKGSGEREPILFTIQYGKGRIFQTVLGHAVANMRDVGFIVTLQRGTEWAATGKVTQKVPADFPTATGESLRTTD